MDLSTTTHNSWWDVGLPIDREDRIHYHAAIRHEVTLQGESARQAVEQAFQEFFAERGENLCPSRVKLREHYFVGYSRETDRYYLIRAKSAKQANTYLLQKKVRCTWLADISVFRLCPTAHASA